MTSYKLSWTQRTWDYDCITRSLRLAWALHCLTIVVGYNVACYMCRITPPTLQGDLRKMWKGD